MTNSTISVNLNPPTAVESTPATESKESARTDVGQFLRRGIIFVMVGFVLYLALYAATDQMIYRFGKRNRFLNIKTASVPTFDYVILGASHAAVFDYLDMNAQLEQRTNSKILNLSVQGVGPVVERVLLNYFFVGHQTKSIVYFVDSFAFNSADWNEKRFSDPKIFNRAPFDPALFQVLWQDPASNPIAWDYLNGFGRINSANFGCAFAGDPYADTRPRTSPTDFCRFVSDTDADEAKFKGVWRPIPQFDKARIDYLYPKGVDPVAIQHYLGEFRNLLASLKARNIRLIVMKTPVPARWLKILPSEAKFDQALKPILDEYGVEYHDFSLVDNDEKFFFNTDHLNQAGVLNFYDSHLKQVLALSSPLAK